MATTVVSLPLTQPHERSLSAENPAEARKRRREILASQRAVSAVESSVGDAAMSASKKQKVDSCDFPGSAQVVDLPPPSITSSSSVTVPPPPALATATAVVTTTKTSKAKRPQMKYDPDVPMTKEEAAAWRREQRRKRNRESAAASRQRQRDRIAELEVEVEEWKSKFEEVMRKIRELEEAPQVSSSSASVDHQSLVEPMSYAEPASPEQLIIQSTEELVEEVFKGTVISPLSSPSHSPRAASPNCAADFSHVEAVKVVSCSVDEAPSHQVNTEGVVEELEPSKMISRPAVKITGSTPAPLLPDDAALSLCPDPCTSLTGIKLDPIDSTLFPRPKDEVVMPTLLTDEEEENAEFGEFLLDAVDWL